MALGYEGWAKLNVSGSTREYLVPCTGASVPENRNRIESSSGYGGRISSPTTEIGIGNPHAYDWSVNEGSISFEATADFITEQLVYWLFHRQNPASVDLKSRRNNVQTFANCFWTSIGLSASSNAFVEGSVNFTAIQRDAYTAGGGYVENRDGDNLIVPPQTFGFPTPLTPNLIVPFWKSYVTIDSGSGGVLVPFETWSLDFSQEVVKFFASEHNSVAQEPKFIAVGPMTATFSGDHIFVQTSTWAVVDVLTSLYINIDTAQVKTKRLERATDSDPVQSMDSPTPISVEYTIYELAP